MTAHTYQVLVWNAGSTSYSTGSVEFTLDHSKLAEPPTINGPTIRPFEGRTEGRPWTVDVVDSSGSFTAQLAGADGRPDLINRWVQVRRGVDGATPVAIGGGRLQDVMLLEDQKTYRMTVAQESVLNDQTLIFSTNTTRLYPPGPHVVYGPFRPPPKGKAVATYQRPLAYLNQPGGWQLKFETGWAPLTRAGLDVLKQDVKYTGFVDGSSGNFVYSRVRIGNTDYKIMSFGSVARRVPVSSGSTAGAQINRNFPDPNVLSGLDKAYDQQLGPIVWIIAASSAFSPAIGARLSSAFIHQFGGPPSEGRPLHIGSSFGTHPMIVKRLIWAGQHAPTGAPVLRYSSAAFNNGSTGLEKLQMPGVRFRITAPQRRGEFITNAINAPFGVCDFIDSSGRLIPKRVWLPASTSVFGFTFTGTNLREPHPTWLQPGGERVTRIELEQTQESFGVPTQLVGVPLPGAPNLNTPNFDANYNGAESGNAGGDGIVAQSVVDNIDHDRIARLGTVPLRIQAIGIHPPIKTDPWIPDAVTPILEAQRQAYRATIEREIFDRWGDGPVQGVLYGMSTASSVEGGDWVRVTLASYPNVGIGTRGGTRLVQVMGKTVGPTGPVFDYLDAGANLNPLAAPTVLLAVSTINRKHVVKATIGSIATGAGFQLEAAISNTTAAPLSASTLWTRVKTVNQSSGSHLITGRPAGSKTWARVRASKALRIRSTWRNSTAGITSSGLAAPTITGVTNIKTESARLGWSGGDLRYEAQVFADTSTSASFSTGNISARLPAGSRYFDYQGLTPNTKHLLGVRMVDQFGGVSASDSTTATTLSTGSTANQVKAPKPVGAYPFA